MESQTCASSVLRYEAEFSAENEEATSESYSVSAVSAGQAQRHLGDGLHARRALCGRPFRTFNLRDESNRQGLAIEVGHSVPSARVIRVLERMIDLYGKPDGLRMDNGPEFISANLEEWCQQRMIRRLFIQPGKPDQNAYIERFNRTYRNEVLDLYIFESIEQVQLITDE